MIVRTTFQANRVCLNVLWGQCLKYHKRRAMVNHIREQYNVQKACVCWHCVVWFLWPNVWWNLQMCNLPLYLRQVLAAASAAAAAMPTKKLSNLLMRPCCRKVKRPKTSRTMMLVYQPRFPMQHRVVQIPTKRTKTAVKWVKRALVSVDWVHWWIQWIHLIKNKKSNKNWKMVLNNSMWNPKMVSVIWCILVSLHRSVPPRIQLGSKHSKTQWQNHRGNAQGCKAIQHPLLIFCWNTQKGKFL